MLSLIHYISAVRRLKESEKTIYMMGGRDGCNEMLLAQHEMIELERDYYLDEAQKFLLICVMLGTLSFIAFVTYKVL
jgi:hypothetical protein